MLTYKGYNGLLEVDTEAGILFGRVLDLRDVITFKGRTVEEAVQAFHDSIEEYLEFCQERGEEPNKPFSGKVPFRTTPDRHRQVYIAARKAGKSLNAWMDDVLGKAAAEALAERSVERRSDSLK